MQTWQDSESILFANVFWVQSHFSYGQFFGLSASKKPLVYLEKNPFNFGDINPKITSAYVPTFKKQKFKENWVNLKKNIVIIIQSPRNCYSKCT